MTRKPYPSDLNHDEWELREQLIPSDKGIGHPQTIDRREIVKAILYWAENGIKWRARPHDLPSWSTVSDYYSRWTKTGVWEQINRKLLKTVRTIEGRDEEPSLVIIASQSVRTVEKRRENRELMAIRKSRVVNGTSS
ncbi:MAG: transposase [Cyanobacteria bacterium P01_E01_bin.35]